MCRSVLILILVLSFTLLGANQSHAQDPLDQYDLAENAFGYQDYGKVITLLEPLLIPEPILPDKDKVLRAREMLGASLWWNGDKAGFKRQFTELLQADARFELDSFYYPPDMVKEFADLKEQLEDAGLIKVVTDDPREGVPPVIIEKTFERRSALLSFVPLGAGQFANGDTGKGIFFLAAEALTLGANVGSWLYMYTEHPSGDIRTAALWTMYGSLVALAGFYVWGVWDAFANFQGPVLLEEKRIEPESDSSTWIHIAPFPISGEGVGLGIFTQF